MDESLALLALKLDILIKDFISLKKVILWFLTIVGFPVMAFITLKLIEHDRVLAVMEEILKRTVP